MLEIFEWASAKAADEARRHPKLCEVWSKFAKIADFVALSAIREADKAFSHFDALDAPAPQLRAPAAEASASHRPKL